METQLDRSFLELLALFHELYALPDYKHLIRRKIHKIKSISPPFYYPSHQDTSLDALHKNTLVVRTIILVDVRVLGGRVRPEETAETFV
jgi:hypothetical protein